MAESFADPDIQRDYQAIFGTSGREARTAAELQGILTTLYRRIFAIDLAHYDIAELRASAPMLIDNLFQLRMRLRDRIPAWQAAGLMTREVQRALRDVFRAARYAGDMIGEMNYGNMRLGEGEKPHKAFQGQPLSVTIHPAFEAMRPIPFEPGDVLLVRGLFHNSAAIARIGDIDSQYCHVGIVHTGDDGRQLLVEALIEEGATINELSFSLADGIGRAALYRPKDAELGRRAAAHMHDHVRRAKRGEIPHIPYDFTMTLDDPRQMFCSKLVYHAYLKASGGQMKMPAFPTRLEMRNADFFKRIGVKAVETFAPGDIEIDPSFECVAEWQDFRVTADMRLQDMIMDKTFAWMEEHGDRFKEDFSIRMIGWFGRLSARLSETVKDLIKDVVPKVPDNMTRRTIQTIAMLHKTGEVMIKHVREIERETIAKHGHPLHPRDVRRLLDEFRAKSDGKIGYLVAGRT